VAIEATSHPFSEDADSCPAAGAIHSKKDFSCPAFASKPRNAGSSDPFFPVRGEL